MIVLVAVTVLFVVQVYVAAAFAPVDGSFASSDQELNAFYDISGTSSATGSRSSSPSPRR